MVRQLRSVILPAALLTVPALGVPLAGQAQDDPSPGGCGQREPGVNRAPGNDRTSAGGKGTGKVPHTGPEGQYDKQRDTLSGGAGNDWIYPSHGRTIVRGGAGTDYVYAFYGKGTIDCGPGRDAARIRTNGAFKTSSTASPRSRVTSTARSPASSRWREGVG